MRGSQIALSSSDESEVQKRDIEMLDFEYPELPADSLYTIKPAKSSKRKKKKKRRTTSDLE